MWATAGRTDSLPPAVVHNEPPAPILAADRLGRQATAPDVSQTPRSASPLGNDQEPRRRAMHRSSARERGAPGRVDSPGRRLPTGRLLQSPGEHLRSERPRGGAHRARRLRLPRRARWRRHRRLRPRVRGAGRSASHPRGGSRDGRAPFRSGGGDRDGPAHGEPNIGRRVAMDRACRRASAARCDELQGACLTGSQVRNNGRDRVARPGGGSGAGSSASPARPARRPRG